MDDKEELLLKSETKKEIESQKPTCESIIIEEAENEGDSIFKSFEAKNIKLFDEPSGISGISIYASNQNIEVTPEN